MKVVDLWGGYRDGNTKAPWPEDTLVMMMSTTKGVSSLAVAVAASRGLISYDAKVADYWPEFAQSGKGAVTVRQLLSHHAGLPVITPPPTLGDVADPAKMSAKIAAQAPPGLRVRDTAITRSRWAITSPNSSAMPTPLGALLANFSPTRWLARSDSTSTSDYRLR